ncbi:MAG: precorrin-2 dehydrogenase/sirohydrochlorin ferrochelatase family protein [bacterium]
MNVNKKNCLVVGGGSVAYRKIIQLVKAGARVKVVAPQTITSIERLKEKHRIKLIKRVYKPSDLNGIFLVYAATNDSEVNRKVFQDAHARSIITNVVDTPAYCDFIMPAIVRKGNIVIAISTQGLAPYATALVKRRINKILSPDYIKVINIVVKLRNILLRMKKRGVDINIKDALNKLSINALSKHIKNKDSEGLKQYINKFLSMVKGA